jgi:hypothetical protein
MKGGAEAEGGAKTPDGCGCGGGFGTLRRETSAPRKAGTSVTGTHCDEPTGQTA